MTVHAAMMNYEADRVALAHAIPGLDTDKLRSLKEGLSGSLGLLLERALDLVAEAEMMLADQRSRIAYLESLTMTDELTSLFNRRGFNEHFARELAAARRHDSSQGLLVLIDLDGFKPINDTHGHLAGDAVLRHVAGLLREGVRETDVVARLGGDEFAVLLTHTSEEAAASRVTALRKAINTTSCVWQGQVLRIGASLGTAHYDDIDTADMVFDRADQRLYADKATRKQRR